MDPIEQTRTRTQAYWFVDGIAEAIGGAALAIVGALLVLASGSDEEAASSFAVIGMIALFPLSAWVVRRLKDRITHPRTGYVRYPEPPASRRRRSLLIAAGFGAVIGLAAALLGEYPLDSPFGTALVALAGVAIAVGLATRAHRFGMPRFYLSAAVTACVVVWTVFQAMGFIQGLGIVWLALGVTSIVTGTTALAGYLRRHPRTGQVSS